MDRQTVIVNWTKSPFKTTYDLEKDDDGFLVKYSDVQELEQENRELKEAIKKHDLEAPVECYPIAKNYFDE